MDNEVKELEQLRTSERNQLSERRLRSFRRESWRSDRVIYVENCANNLDEFVLHNRCFNIPGLISYILANDLRCGRKTGSSAQAPSDGGIYRKQT